MDKITIRKESQDGYTFYSFKPVTFIDDFFELVGVIPGVGYDRKLCRWTAPGRQETTSSLKQIFGVEALKWESPEHFPTGRVSDGRPPADKPARRVHRPKSSLVPKQWREALLRTEEQLRVRRYSHQTVKSYLYHLRDFFHTHPDESLGDIDSRIIRSYIVRRVAAGSYSESTQNQMLNAVKFWLEQVEGREKAFYDLRPKKKKKLPTVLSVEEAQRLFNAVHNLKHRCILKIIYGGGLRLSEAVNLRIADVHSDRLQLFVHGGKGKKDRYTTLSRKFLEELRRYYVEYQPRYWLFEGQTGGAYSVRSVQAILRKAVDRSGINPYCTVHTLRHSYATHLLEAGTSLRHIQELLGHANSSTTEIYTHVSNSEKQRVISPLDRLD